MRDMAGGGGGMGSMVMALPRADHGPTHKMSVAIMHMSFFWGDCAVVLFPSWPGYRGAGMYLLCLLFVLALAALTEALALLSRRLARRGVGGDGDGGAPATASSAALMTAVHAVRMEMAYLVMLAVMSFNVGVLLAASPATPSGSSSRGAGCAPARCVRVARSVSSVASAPDGFKP